MADPHTPLGVLATHLRRLRISATLTYTDMDRMVTASASALSEAAAGRGLSRLSTVRDYVTACCGDDPARLRSELETVERLWRRAARHLRAGETPPAPIPERVSTPAEFELAVLALLRDHDLPSLRAVEQATTARGDRVPRSTLSRYLHNGPRPPQVMPTHMLTAILDICRIHDHRQRKAWTQARDRAAITAAGLPPATTAAHLSADRALRVVPHPAAVTAAPAVRVTREALTEDLLALCRGRGTTTPNLHAHLGPALTAVLAAAAPPTTTLSLRTRLTGLLLTTARILPPDHHAVFLCAANIEDKKARNPAFPPVHTSAPLTARLELLSAATGRSTRTLQRHLRHAAQRLAEHLHHRHHDATTPDHRPQPPRTRATAPRPATPRPATATTQHRHTR